MKKLQSTTTIISLIFLFVGCNSNKMDHPEKIELLTKMDTISYIIGLDYGTGINEQDIEISKEAVFKGLMDGYNGTDIIDDSLKTKYINDFNAELQEKNDIELQKELENNLRQSEYYINNRRSVEGVKEFESGLLFLVIKKGTGPKITETDSVKVHYRGTFINGETFDMSYERGPVVLKVDELIAGLTEGLTNMQQGGIYKLFIPPNLAYGNVSFANVIPPGSALTYRIEILKVYK